MNCAGDTEQTIDDKFSQCGECQKKLSDAEKALEDCWWDCMSRANEYQCDNLTNDRCAMDCTGEEDALVARTELTEVGFERFRHQICWY